MVLMPTDFRVSVQEVEETGIPDLKGPLVGRGHLSEVHPCRRAQDPDQGVGPEVAQAIDEGIAANHLQGVDLLPDDDPHLDEAHQLDEAHLHAVVLRHVVVHLDGVRLQGGCRLLDVDHLQEEHHLHGGDRRTEDL